MPGLIGAVARTAVVAGTATAVSNRVSRRQGQRWGNQGQSMPAYMAPTGGQQPQQQYPPQQQQYAAPPPQQYAPLPPAPAPDPIAQLKELAALHEQGVLTDDEFSREKAKLLA